MSCNCLTSAIFGVKQMGSTVATERTFISSSNLGKPWQKDSMSGVVNSLNDHNE